MSHQNFTATITEPTRIITVSPVIRSTAIIPPTGVVAGTYVNPTIEIDLTGRIVSAENGSTGNYYSGIAATTLSGHRAIAYNSSGELEYAEIDDPSYSHRFAGVSLNAVTIGENVSFVSTGILEESSWNWVVGYPVFLGAGGTLIQSPPLAGLLLEVGEAIASTKIFLRIKPGIFKE